TVTTPVASSTSCSTMSPWSAWMAGRITSMTFSTFSRTGAPGRRRTDRTPPACRGRARSDTFGAVRSSVVPRLVLHHRVDDAGLERLRRPRTRLVAERGDGADRLVVEEGPVRTYVRTLVVEAPDDPDDPDAEPGTHLVTEEIRYELAVPLFGFLFAPVVRRELARHAHLVAVGDDGS